MIVTNHCIVCHTSPNESRSFENKSGRLYYFLCFGISEIKSNQEYSSKTRVAFQMIRCNSLIRRSWGDGGSAFLINTRHQRIMSSLTSTTTTTATATLPEFKQAALETHPHCNSLHGSSTSLALLNSQHTYILQSKGYSKLNADGTGIGIVLMQQELDNNNNEQHVKITARQYFPSDRALSLAEYSALITGLQYAVQLGLRHIVLETDHVVLAKQLQGIFPMEKQIMKPLYWQVMHIVETQLETFSVRIVDHVEEATELAKKALATNKSFMLHSADDEQQKDPMGRDFVGQGKQRKLSNNTTVTTPAANSAATTTPQTQTATTIDPDRTYLLQFDGGARGNPSGKSGSGMVLFDDQGHEVWCGWKYLPPMSNNLAEYHSVLLGLQCAQSLGMRRLRAQGDSELVVKQLNGVYQVKDLKLRELWKATKAVMQEFTFVEISHMGRESNKRADWLANHAMDTESSFGFHEH